MVTDKEVDEYLESKPLLSRAIKRLLMKYERDYMEIERARYVYTVDEYGELDEYGASAKELHQSGTVPGRSYPGDAGIDLPIVLSKEGMKQGKKVIWPGERVMLHTGIIMEFPVGYFGRIIHRSSTERTHRLRVIEGIIDDYRGEVLVQVHNGNQCQVEVYHGNRLAQMILAKTAPFRCEEAEDGKLRPSARGPKGFGSSGK